MLNYLHAMNCGITIIWLYQSVTLICTVINLWDIVHVFRFNVSSKIALDTGTVGAQMTLEGLFSRVYSNVPV